MTDFGVIPALRVGDMTNELAFYRDTLGFNLERGGPDEEHCSLSFGAARLMLEVAANFYTPRYNEAIRERLGAHSATALYIQADDLEGLQRRLLEVGAPIVDPLADRAWGQAEFTIEDPEGNWLTFWRALDPAHQH